MVKFALLVVIPPHENWASIWVNHSSGSIGQKGGSLRPALMVEMSAKCDPEAVVGQQFKQKSKRQWQD